MKLRGIIGVLLVSGGVVAGLAGCQVGATTLAWPTAATQPEAQGQTPTATPSPPTIALALPPIRQPVAVPETTPTPAGTVTPGSSVVTATTPAVSLSPLPSPQAPALEGKLVFETAGGGEVYVVAADGTGLRRLTHGLDPSWSPDGRWVAFTRWEEKAGVYVVGADGREERQVVGVERARWPSWSPDGERLVFSFQGPAGPGEWRLAVVGVHTGELFHLPCDGYSFAPNWSPDGSLIVYDGLRGLQVVSPDGSVHRGLTDNHHHRFPVWSPDGRRIAFTFHQHDHEDIYVVGAGGGQPVPLTRPPYGARRAVDDVSPAWSPDGRHLAFLSDRDGEWAIYVMAADGSGQRPMFPGGLAGLTLTYGWADDRMLSWSGD